MNIGIVSYFNPKEVEEYLDSNQVIPNINQTATAVNTLVKEFLEQGHHVTVFTSTKQPGNTIQLKGDKINIFIISSYAKAPHFSLFSRLYMANRIKKIIATKIKQLDVLHAHWTYDYALAAQYFADKVPVICTVRDWCPYQLSITKHLGGKIYWIISYYIFRKVMRNNHTHFIANSKYTYNCIKDNYPQKNVDIIPNPIKKEFILNEKVNYPTITTFISISQFIETRKNIKNLLLAFHQYHINNPNSILLLIGQDFVQSNKFIQKWSKENLLAGVKLCGAVNHNNLIKYLDQATALIHPSLEETFGNIILEGISRCIPVIGGKNSGAIPDILGHGKFGILCDVSNPQDILNAMHKAEDILISKELTNKATDYIKENYQSDKIAYKHIEYYKELIK